MFWEVQPPQRSPAARLKLWGGMVLAVGLMLLLVKLVMLLTWFGPAVTLVGLAMLLVGTIWGDVRRKRQP